MIEMIEGEDRPKIHDVEVVGWADQAGLAEDFRLTPRQIQNLERRGLPAEGSHATKRYPVPHAFIWFLRYRVHVRLGEVVERLPFEVAYAEDRAAYAEERATHARMRGELCIRPRGKAGRW